MTLVEHGFNPRALGYHFGYDEPRVIRRIDELAELKNGWHFGAGIAPSSSVLAVAKVVASYAVSRRLPDIDAFPGKSGEVTIAIYLGEEDHSFQVRQNLSFRYWSESNPDSEVEEGLSFRDVIQKIDVIARAQPSWNLFSSFIFDIGTVISGTLEARLFENSSDGSGISVVDFDCIRRGQYGCVCEHARRFYPTVSSEPPIFWKFDESILPTGYRLKQEPSNSGDECHHNIQGIKDGKEQKFFKKIRNEGKLAFEICDGNVPRTLNIPGDINILLGEETH